ncbi:ribonuclease P protein subunit [Candidatus Woesearchaeota archaeon]|nr:hypothetical protein [uncultured archaeon]AQS32300.1 hypothetical protein [uncultured archaeon]MBS3149415.1 ribonuclease P protein subunit [Candidatus Woesearchaeota archaeon]
MIGAQIDIVDSKNLTLNGLKGTVIDETRNTIIVKSNNKVKNVIKNQIKFVLITKNNMTIKSNGTSLIGGKKIKLEDER